MSLAISLRLPVCKLCLVTLCLSLIFCAASIRAQTEKSSPQAGESAPLPASVKEAEAEVKRLLKEAGELEKKKQIDPSSKLAERALLILEKMPEAGTTDIAGAMQKLGWEYRGQNERLAERLYERVVAILDKQLKPDDLKHANAFLELGYVYASLGKYDPAIQSFKRALPLFEKRATKFWLEGKAGKHDVANVLISLAGAYEGKGDYSESDKLYQQALELMEEAEGKDASDTAHVLLGMAGSYLERGQYARAEALYQRALAIVEKKPDANETPRVLRDAGVFYSFKGDYVRAVQLLERSLALYEKRGKSSPEVMASAIFTLAQLSYLKDGDPVRAEPHYLRALSLIDKANGPDSLRSTRYLEALASLYQDKGDYARAEQLLRRVLAIRERVHGPEHPAVGSASSSLADILMYKYDYERAEQLYRRALSLREKAYGPEHNGVAASLLRLGGIISRSRADFAEAEKLIKRALAIYQKNWGNEHPGTAAALNSLGMTYLKMGDMARAEPLLQQVLVIYEKTYGAKHRHIVLALNNLTRLYEQKGEMARAVQLSTRAAEIAEYNLKLILATGSEKQKRLYMTTLSSETQNIISLHARYAPANTEAARLALTTILRRKGRILDITADQIGALRSRLNEQDRALLDELLAARSHLAAISLKAPEKMSAADYRAEVKRLEGETERLEAQIGSRGAELRAETESVTLDSIRQNIPKDGALVEIASYKPYDIVSKKSAEAWGKTRYVAYVLRREGEPVAVDLGEAASIDANIKALRLALRDPKNTEVRPIARALDEQVMRPVRKLAGDARLLLISPDGALNLVPFAALVDEQNRYLVESHTIDYLTSGRDLLRLERRAAGKPEILVVANPTYELAATTAASEAGTRGEAADLRSLDFTKARISPLPGTAAEAEALKNILPGVQLLTGAEATEAALKRVNAPRILHVATHGFFFSDSPQTQAADARLLVQEEEDKQETAASRSNPLLRSGLVLAGVKNRQSGAGEDGVLTALEAASLDLFGTRLVTLSACETGVGDVASGDGVYGLRRALVLAGAESQLMSLWQVSDAATRDLMVSYYKRLSAGEDRAEALRRVQLEMLKSGGAPSAATGANDSTDRSHPFYWASFIPIGDWRGLQL